LKLYFRVANLIDNSRILDEIEDLEVELCKVINFKN